MNRATESARNADVFEVIVLIGENAIVAEVNVNYKDVEILNTWLVHPDCPDVRMPFDIDGLQSRTRASFTYEPLDSLIEIAAHEALL